MTGVEPHKMTFLALFPGRKYSGALHKLSYFTIVAQVMSQFTKSSQNTGLEKSDRTYRLEENSDISWVSWSSPQTIVMLFNYETTCLPVGYARRVPIDGS
jgi:hypothetical protein